MNREIGVGREISTLRWVLFGFAMGCVEMGLIDIGVGSVEIGVGRWKGDWHWALLQIERSALEGRVKVSGIWFDLYWIFAGGFFFFLALFFFLAFLDGRGGLVSMEER